MSTLESLSRTSGDHRIVWEVVYAYNYSHRVPDGYMDDRYSHTTRERETTHIIAPTLEMAKLAFAHKYPTHCDYEFVHADPLCTVNFEIGIGGERFI